MYRHPCMQHSESNDEYLKVFSEKLIVENKEFILLDDFNIDLLKCFSNPHRWWKSRINDQRYDHL